MIRGSPCVAGRASAIAQIGTAHKRDDRDGQVGDLRGDRCDHRRRRSDDRADAV